MNETLITLAHFHYWLGYINHDEFVERVKVALWLLDDGNSHTDPRLDVGDEENGEPGEPRRDESANSEPRRAESRGSQKQSDPAVIELVCLGVWVFTKSDPDSYPSVPHGHYQDQNSNWPKLNPYTGRVFSAKHQENKGMRLSKSQMREIWRNRAFRSFCREMIVWYQEAFPSFDFPVMSPLKLPRW